VSELDEAWALALAEAEQRARASGRGDIADYIALRTSNDLMRRTAIDWLLSTLTILAGEANRAGHGIRIETEDGHRFRVGSSTMVGTRLTLRLGVRALFVEAGWPRRPGDGIVRGGGLACGRIGHFGKLADDDEVLLVGSAQGAPQWSVVGKNGQRVPLAEGRLKDHFSLFISS
jgi:hypothetical protein